MSEIRDDDDFVTAGRAFVSPVSKNFEQQQIEHQNRIYRAQVRLSAAQLGIQLAGQGVSADRVIESAKVFEAYLLDNPPDTAQPD